MENRFSNWTPLTLSLFDPKSVQAVMNGFRMINIAPFGESIKDAKTIEFNFPTIETPTYYDLSDTTLYLSFLTKTANGADPTQWHCSEG